MTEVELARSGRAAWADIVDDLVHISGVSAQQRFWAIWMAGLMVWGGTLALATPHDLSLAERSFAPGSAVGWVVYYLGEVPSWALVALSLLSLAAHRRGWRWPRLPLPLAATVVLLWLIYPTVVTRSLKLLWGRVRFANLDKARLRYTPFYVPAGPGAGQSFPSGHVASAFLWAPLPLYLAAVRRTWAARLAGLLVLAWGGLVVWGRMLAGDHFLTDGLFSAGAMLLLAPLLLRWQLRRARAARRRQA